jgi:hypothetical protein
MIEEQTDLIRLTDSYDDTIGLTEVERGDGSFLCVEVFEGDGGPKQVLMTPKQARILSDAFGAFAVRNGA